MTRKEAAHYLSFSSCTLSTMCTNTQHHDAKQMGIKSLTLWDEFIERLAEKCNNSGCAAEWNIYRKGIELIKAEFDERIG